MTRRWNRRFVLWGAASLALGVAGLLAVAVAGRPVGATASGGEGPLVTASGSLALVGAVLLFGLGLYPRFATLAIRTWRRRAAGVPRWFRAYARLLARVVIALGLTVHDGHDKWEPLEAWPGR